MQRLANLLIQPNSKWLPALVGMVALMFSLLFWFFVPESLLDSQGTDFVNYYYHAAVNIAAGLGITLDGTDLAMKFPPGHALIVAGFLKGGDLLKLSPAIILAFLSAICAVIAAVLVYQIAVLIWNPLAAFIAALAWIVYPFALQLFAVGIDGRPLSEVTFIPVFLGSVLAVQKIYCNKGERTRDYAIAGFLVGVATLIRPFAFGVILVFLVIVLSYARRFNARTVIKGSMLMLLAYFLVLLPWEIAITRQTGHFIWLSTVGEGNAGNGLVSFAITAKEYRQTIPVPDDVMGLMERYIVRRGEMLSYSDLMRVVVEEAAAAPVATAKLFGIKALRSWYATDSGRYESLTKFVQLFYLLPITAGFYFVVRFHQSARSFALLVAGLVLYFWVMNMAVLPVVRYMLPVMALLIVFIPGALLFGRSLIPTFDKLIKGNGKTIV